MTQVFSKRWETRSRTFEYLLLKNSVLRETIKFASRTIKEMREKIDVVILFLVDEFDNNLNFNLITGVMHQLRRYFTRTTRYNFQLYEFIFPYLHEYGNDIYW